MSSPPRSPYRSPPPNEYDPTDPSYAQEPSNPQRTWLQQTPELVASSNHLRGLLEKPDNLWERQDYEHVEELEKRFQVYDMDSFYRVQGHQWLLYNPEACDQNGFLARIFQNLQQGHTIPARELDTLNRTVWKFMDEEERAAAAHARRDAEGHYGRSEPVRRRPRRQQQQPPPTVAGYPFEIAEAYLNCHRADADHFATDYFAQRRAPPRPSYNNVPYGY